MIFFPDWHEILPCLELPWHCDDLTSGAPLNLRNIKYAWWSNHVPHAGVLSSSHLWLVITCTCSSLTTFFYLTWFVCHNLFSDFFSPMLFFCLSYLPCLQSTWILILVSWMGPGLSVVFKNADLWRCHNSSMSWVSTLPPSLTFSFSCICDDKHYSCLTHTQLCYFFYLKMMVFLQTMYFVSAFPLLNCLCCNKDHVSCIWFCIMRGGFFFSLRLFISVPFFAELW